MKNSKPSTSVPAQQGGAIDRFKAIDVLCADVIGEDAHGDKDEALAEIWKIARNGWQKMLKGCPR